MSRDLTTAMQDLLVQNLKLTQQLKQFENDYEREVEYNRGSQKREKLQSDEIRQMKACFVRTMAIDHVASTTDSRRHETRT